MKNESSIQSGESAYTDEEILDLRPIVGVHEDSVHGVNSSGEKGDGIFTAAIDLGTTTIVDMFPMVELGKLGGQKSRIKSSDAVWRRRNSKEPIMRWNMAQKR